LHVQKLVDTISPDFLVGNLLQKLITVTQLSLAQLLQKCNLHAQDSKNLNIYVTTNQQYVL